MNNLNKTEISGIGRRKTSIASIILIPNLDNSTKNLFEVNGRLSEKYFEYNFNFINKI